MLYVIIGEDTPGTLNQRMLTRPAHVDSRGSITTLEALMQHLPNPTYRSRKA